MHPDFSGRSGVLETFKEETEIVQEFLNDLGELIVVLNGYDDVDGALHLIEQSQGFSGQGILGSGRKIQLTVDSGNQKVKPRGKRKEQQYHQPSVVFAVSFCLLEIHQ